MKIEDKVQWQGEDGPMVGTIVRVADPWVDPWNRQALPTRRTPDAAAPAIETRDHESYVVLGQLVSTAGDDALLALRWPEASLLAIVSDDH